MPPGCFSLMRKIIVKIKVDRFVAQVLTGHDVLSAYLNRFKCKESPSSVCESIPHVLLDSPVHDYERHKIETQRHMRLDVRCVPRILQKLCMTVNNRNSVY
ncbi:unnamed protein product [Euphydryas editha]|uniref:Uncharacterized protein n=1 Tax=Euphydryas editha TaxID=104508 RepID=A0AAU9U2Y3_EUPED|nr:unnamed protein product [Euphydryas editha]